MSKYAQQDFTELWASAGDKITPSDFKIQTGWEVEKPIFQYMNWVQGRQDTMLAYLNQQGLPEWDATVEYQNGSSFISYGGLVYKSIQTGTNKNPATETAYWSLAFATYGASSEIFAGSIELATQAETNTGTDDARAVTPLKLATYVTQRQATESLKGVAEVATDAEITTGTDDARIVTPLKLKNRLVDSSETVKGLIEIATQAETTTGSDDVRAITPLKLKQLVDARVVSASETAQGIIEIATQAEANALADTGRALVPSVLTGIWQVGQTLATEGSQPFVGGLIVKWGTSGSISGNGTLGITFATAFPNSCYAVFTTKINSDVSQEFPVDVSSVSASGFTAVNTGSASMTAYWFAIGK